MRGIEGNVSAFMSAQHILKTLDPDSKPLDPFPMPAALVVVAEEPPRNLDPPAQSRIAPRNLESCRCRVEPAGGQLDCLECIVSALVDCAPIHELEVVVAAELVAVDIGAAAFGAVGQSVSTREAGL